MKKTLFSLLLLSSLSFGLDFRPTSIKSEFQARDSVWFRNNTSLPVTIKQTYVKVIAGGIGTELMFKVSNEKKEVMNGMSHRLMLDHVGDSLYVNPLFAKDNPAIKIPAFDSVSLKTILYGTCIFCVSMHQYADYTIEVHFISDKNEHAKLTVIGQFITGRLVTRIVPDGEEGTGAVFRIDGKLAEVRTMGRAYRARSFAGN